MKIYPAIDILGGKAVRLKQGRKHDVTVYGDPVDMALKWVGKGAEWLHVVDLDGAFEGSPRNVEVLRNMAAAVPQAKIQVGGGIRRPDAVDTVLEAGIHRVILGTAAVQDEPFLKEILSSRPEKVAVGIDARDGIVRISGWTEASRTTATDFARHIEDLGARLIIYTDISRDGVLQGPNVEAMKDMLDQTGLSVIGSGGVTSLSDVQQLAGIGHPRLVGVIIGKALYEDRIRIEEALACAC
jgi:phosphoribosylformimino-5-aminoimidazole carboxamide ribotide isomerase